MKLVFGINEPEFGLLTLHPHYYDKDAKIVDGEDGEVSVIPGSSPKLVGCSLQVLIFYLEIQWCWVELPEFPDIKEKS
jgi:hypothetical protein